MGRTRTVCVASLFAIASAGCRQQSPPLVEVPGAIMVAAAADAGALVGVAELVTRAGILPSSPEHDALLARLKAALPGRPLVASALENGSWVIASRAPRGSSVLATAGDVVIGEVRRADALLGGALMRIDGDRVLIGIPGGTDPLALAGLMEALASSSPQAPARALVPDGAIHLHARSLGPLSFDPPLHLIARAVDDELRIDEAAPAPVREALRAPAPATSCAFEDAALLLSIPPMSGVAPATAPIAADSFNGRVVVALYPSAEDEAPSRDDPLSYLSLVVLGVPRDDAAGADLFDSAVKAAGPNARVKRVDDRAELEVSGARPLRVVSGPGLFAVALGKSAPVERAWAEAPCAGRDAPLVLASGPSLARIVLPALITPDVVMKALGGSSVDDALPLARLRGIRSLRVDAREGIRARVAFDVPK